jgi:hypothetical protein
MSIAKACSRFHALVFCASLGLLMLLPARMRAQTPLFPEMSGTSELTLNNQNTAGPVIVYFNGQYEILIANHSSPYDICVSFNFSSSCTDTGIATGGLHQISATIYNGLLYVLYTNPNSTFMMGSSSNGSSFSTWMPLWESAPPNEIWPTALSTYNGDLVAAFITGSDPNDYPAWAVSSNNGQTFSGGGGLVNDYEAVSGPSLATYEGVLWLGFVSSSGGSSARYPVVGPIYGSPDPFEEYTNNIFSNSNTTIDGQTIYAGMAMVGVPGEGLYIFAQDYFSEQTLWITGSTTGYGFPEALQPSTTQAFRWTPSAVLAPDNSTIYLAVQRDSDTNTNYSHSTSYVSWP